MLKRYKLVVFVPQAHLEQVRTVICNAGAGKIGRYDHCTFMSSGIGTYRPLEGAKPFKGEVGKIERVGEARLEVTVEEKYLKAVIKAMKKVHPYEEVAYDIYPMRSVSES